MTSRKSAFPLSCLANRVLSKRKMSILQKARTILAEMLLPDAEANVANDFSAEALF